MASAVATIHAALDAGVALLDTGDFYGMGHNEMLIRDALAARRREEALISVKFGALRGPDNRWAGNDCRPAAVRNFLAYTLRRLGTDHVDVYRPARAGPDGADRGDRRGDRRLVEEGYVRQIGLSEVSAETLRRAHAVHPICDVQIEYSLLSRGPEGSSCRRAASSAVAVTAYGVLSRGLLGGHCSAGAAGSRRATSAPMRRASRARTSRTTSTSSSGSRAIAEGGRAQRRAARDRLGPGPRRGRRRAGRRAHARAPRRRPRRPRGPPRRGHGRRARRGVRGRRRGRRALPAGRRWRSSTASAAH